MSGGYFDYNERSMLDIAEMIDYAIGRNRHLPDGHESRLSDETIRIFRKGAKKIRKAYVYAKRIDYLLSGDDGEEDLKPRIKEDLDALKISETILE